ncbi:MAG: site-2 protease family protein [Kiritimatiellaceae bacterium]|nr:site-2 protease family protein [Kiritimatiellaceae bacterium]
MKMVNNALSIGSVLGIPIRLHISLLIAIGILSIFSGAQPLVILILAVGLFGSVALHELGHSVVAQAKGGYIHEIVLYPFGGAAKIENLPKRPIDEIMVALAGPAVSLALALIFRQFELTYFLGYLNGMLFFFNILPVFPMDGGRVLRAALTLKYGRVVATKLAATTGKYFCILFVLIGLFGMPQLFGIIGPFKPSLMLAFIGVYIYSAGKQEYRMVLMEHQANSFSGFKEGNVEIEVSPPPYASGPGSHMEPLADKLKNLFRK